MQGFNGTNGMNGINGTIGMLTTLTGTLMCHQILNLGLHCVHTADLTT